MESVLNHPMFQDVQIERIRACDGSKENIDDFLEFQSPYQKSTEVTSLEYGCTISHFRAIEALSMTDPAKVPFALIVEDDLSLDFVPHWKQPLQTYIDGCPTDWEVIQLSYIPIESAIPSFIKYDRWEITKNICGASAYLMTHAAATRMMSKLKTHHGKYCIGPPHLRGSIVSYKADWLIYALLRTYTVNPPLFTYRDDNDSNIHPEHVIHQAESKRKTQQLYR
jgi:GR25 family glycosyltransferase involved in LPS biosynthesis